MNHLATDEHVVLGQETVTVNRLHFTVLILRNSYRPDIPDFSGVAFDPSVVYIAASLYAKPGAWWQAVVEHEIVCGFLRQGEYERCGVAFKRELKHIPPEEQTPYLQMRQRTILAEVEYFRAHPVKAIPDLLSMLYELLKLIEAGLWAAPHPSPAASA